MMVLKQRFHNKNTKKGSTMMVLKQFKKVPQWWYQNSLKRFHNDGTDKLTPAYLKSSWFSLQMFLISL